MPTIQSRDGTTLAYDVYGSGPALIYITGASCFRTFRPIVHDAKTFATAFTVYTYDRRGRGDSGNTLPYAVAREVEDIAAMIDAAGGTAHLFGHSSGAVLALEAALRFGNTIGNVVLYDPSYVNDEAEQAQYASLSQQIHTLLQRGNHAHAMKTFLRGIGMPKAFVYLLPLMRDWKTMVALAPTLAYDLALTRDLPPLDRAAHVSVPVLVLVGEKSPARIHDNVRQLTTAMPGATCIQLVGQDHMASATAVLPVLTSFLKPHPHAHAVT